MCADVQFFTRTYLFRLYPNKLISVYFIRALSIIKKDREKKKEEKNEKNEKKKTSRSSSRSFLTPVPFHAYPESGRTSGYRDIERCLPRLAQMMICHRTDDDRVAACVLSATLHFAHWLALVLQIGYIGINWIYWHD